MTELRVTPTAFQAGDAALVNRAGNPAMVVLGTAATTPASDYATAAQGALADTAMQPGDLATVATSGAYVDLSGRPTLGGAAALNVGTTAGTVAAGNDARLTDAREWTAATILQAEAEAGTATTRRAWTAQRVRQAIAAWWATITLTKADVGLANVDNTADAAKSVASAATLTTARNIALGGDVSGSASFNGSANITITATVADDSHNHVIANVDGLQTELNNKAPLASPIFTGTPAAPTATPGTNTTQVATTAFVQAAVVASGGGDMLESVYDTNGDGKVNAADVADAVPWTGVTSKPATFPPEAHTHPASAVTDFAEAVDDRVATMLTAGANVTITYNDTANTLTVAASSAATNLGYTAATRLLTSSTGTDVTLPLVGAEAGLMTAADKTKIDGVATGATANSADATLLARANHTGTQAASTITGLATVATTGAYGDLSGLPTLGTAAATNATAYATAAQGAKADTAVQGTSPTGTATTIIWTGSAAEYSAIGTPDAATLYIVI